MEIGSILLFLLLLLQCLFNRDQKPLELDCIRNLSIKSEKLNIENIRVSGKVIRLSRMRSMIYICRLKFIVLS